MSGFSESTLTQKLVELNSSALSIQSVSLWLLHHRKHYQTCVKIWYKELGNTKKERKLTMLYLANDVVQNAKKKYPDIPKEFGKVMKPVFAHLAAMEFDSKTDASLERLVKIWKERQIFDKNVIGDIEKVWGVKSNLNVKTMEDSLSSPSPRKKACLEESNLILTTNQSSPLLAVQNESNSQIKDHNSNCDPAPNRKSSTSKLPQCEDLINALQQLEASASSDADVRELIAKFPPEVSDIGSIEHINSEDDARRQLAQLEEASSLLREYNIRLQQELQERTKVAKMISIFMEAQEELLSKGEERLEEYRDKLDKVNQSKSELEAHLASLPDIPIISRLEVPGPDKLFPTTDTNS